MKKICLILFAMFYFLISFGQGLKIVEVKETASGTESFHAPKDGNGHPCGLVKVQSVIQDLSFSGNLVGDVVFDNNEYKVFMGKGSKQLIIKRPQIIPVVISFPDYGIDEVSSKATYNIKLKDMSLNPEKNLLIIDVKPRSAKVYLDDILINNEYDDGGYRLLLTKGEHLCKVEAKGYRTYASAIKIGKGPLTINAELESLLADIDIVCQTSEANIFVDGKKVGVGSWKGKLPAGAYKVEAKLDGWASQCQTLDLAEKDSRSIIIPALKRAKGLVLVRTNVNNAQVFIDGNLWDDSSKAKEVSTGIHKLLVKTPFGYKNFEKDFVIKSDSQDTISVTLKPTNEMYARAFKGDVKAMATICHEKIESSKYSEQEIIERNYWFDRIYANLDKIDKQSFNLVCPCVDNGAGCSVEKAGLYAFFQLDYAKGLRVLQTWIKFDPDNDSVVLKMVGILSKLKNYEAVIKWGTRGLDVCGFDGYMNGFIEYIAEACIMLGDANRAIQIFKQHVYEEYGWDNGYISIASVYKKKGDCRNAVVFYKKYLQEHTSDSYGIEEAKIGIKECGY